MRRTIIMTGCLAGHVRRAALPARADAAPNQVRGTVVRFSGNDVHVDVTIRSNHRTSRDFVSMLPLRLKLQDLAGTEKISYLPRKLRTKGSPGSIPRTATSSTTRHGATSASTTTPPGSASRGTRSTSAATGPPLGAWLGSSAAALPCACFAADRRRDAAR